MPAPPLSPAAVNMMFLPNRKGTFYRDTEHRQKAHRTALRSIRGDVDTRHPRSMQFPRAVDLKKALRQEDRVDYVDKCNRKLVDKMMMIMQGLCGPMLSGRTSSLYFNPGTLNHGRRRREMQRIDQDNLAMMHRLESASSAYSQYLLKPKHFQDPRLGLYPRSVQSARSAGPKSRGGSSEKKRKRACNTLPCTPASTSRPGGGGNSDGLAGGASVTSALTEGSAILALGKYQEGSIVVDGLEGEWPWGGDAGDKSRSGSPKLADGGFTGAPARTASREPRPPAVPSRAACGSSPRTTSSHRKCPRKLKPAEAKPETKPGGTVFCAGIKLGSDYVKLTATRVKRSVGADGPTNGFRLVAYRPSTLSIYTLEVDSSALTAFTCGSRTAVRFLSQPGENSRRKWERVASFLELRSLSPPAETCADDDSVGGRSAGGESDKKSAAASEMSPDAPKNDKEGPALDLEGKEEDGDGEGAGAATAALLALQMVLVQPEDAPIVIIQSVVRGLIALRKYRLMKSATVIIQAAFRGWKYRTDRRRHQAATKIATMAPSKHKDSNSGKQQPQGSGTAGAQTIGEPPPPLVQGKASEETRQATRGSSKCVRGGNPKRRSTPTAASPSARGVVPGRRNTPAAAAVAAARGGGGGGGGDTPYRPGSRPHGADDGFSSSTTTIAERYGGSARGRRSPGRTGRANGAADGGGSSTTTTAGGRQGLSVEGRKPPGIWGGRSTTHPDISSPSPRASTATGGRNNASSRGACRRERNTFSAGNNGFSGEKSDENPWITTGSGATAAALMPARSRRPKLPEAKKLKRLPYHRPRRGRVTGTSQRPSGASSPFPPSSPVWSPARSTAVRAKTSDGERVIRNTGSSPSASPGASASPGEISAELPASAAPLTPTSRQSPRSPLLSSPPPSPMVAVPVSPPPPSGALAAVQTATPTREENATQAPAKDQEEKEREGRGSGEKEKEGGGEYQGGAGKEQGEAGKERGKGEEEEARDGGTAKEGKGNGEMDRSRHASGAAADIESEVKRMPEPAHPQAQATVTFKTPQNGSGQEEATL